jgi:hypothetical protein
VIIFITIGILRKDHVLKKTGLVLNSLGWLGFALLLPVVLQIFYRPAAIETLQNIFGTIINPSTLSITAFALIGVQAIFGGGEHIAATGIGLITGFILVSIALDIGFMKWLSEPLKRVSMFSNLHLVYICGIGVVLTGMILSFLKPIPVVINLVLLVIVPTGILGLSSAFNLFEFDSEFDISLKKGLDYFKGMVDEKYVEKPEIREFVEEVAEDASLSLKEKEARIAELQQKIRKLETDTRLLDSLKVSNDQFREMLEEQKRAMADFGFCAGATKTEERLRELITAVRGRTPCVRDFAVSLAKHEKGPYSPQYKDAPGKSGLSQIFAIHLYLSTNWNYVSDPIIGRDDYYSAANRTIALGFAGDCDDFSVLMASCIEAIGGRARIVAGTCAGGGHAWAEVLIGNESQWMEARRVFSDRLKGSPETLNATIDENGRHWLPLDWQLGRYSCHESNLTLLYESPVRPSQSSG